MTSAASSSLGVPPTDATTRPFTDATYATSAANSCAAEGEKPKTPLNAMADKRTTALVTFAEIIGLPLRYATNLLILPPKASVRLKEVTPSSSQATASPSMMQERERRRVNVSMIGRAALQPPGVPLLRPLTSKPSC